MIENLKQLEDKYMNMIMFDHTIKHEDKFLLIGVFVFALDCVSDPKLLDRISEQSVRRLKKEKA